MNYQIMRKIEDQTVTIQFRAKTPEGAAKIAAALGIEGRGFNTQANVRGELQGQPKFAGLNGPMFNGYCDISDMALILYEDAQIYAENCQ